MINYSIGSAENATPAPTQCPTAKLTTNPNDALTAAPCAMYFYVIFNVDKLMILDMEIYFN